MALGRAGVRIRMVTLLPISDDDSQYEIHLYIYRVTRGVQVSSASALTNSRESSAACELAVSGKCDSQPVHGFNSCKLQVMAKCMLSATL